MKHLSDCEYGTHFYLTFIVGQIAPLTNPEYIVMNVICTVTKEKQAVCGNLTKSSIIPATLNFIGFNIIEETTFCFTFTRTWEF